MKVIVEPHRHGGVYIAKGKEDVLATKNLVPGDTVYGEKKIEVNYKFTRHSLKCYRLRYQLQKAAQTQSRKSSTDHGIPSVLNWPPLSSVVSTIFTWVQARR